MKRNREPKLERRLAHLVFFIGFVVGLVCTALGVLIGAPVALLFNKKIKMGDADLTV